MDRWTAVGRSNGCAAAVSGQRHSHSLSPARCARGCGTLPVGLRAAICLAAYLATGAIFLRSVDLALEQRVAVTLSGDDGPLSR